MPIKSKHYAESEVCVTNLFLSNNDSCYIQYKIATLYRLNLSFGYF